MIFISFLSLFYQSSVWSVICNKNVFGGINSKMKLNNYKSKQRKRYKNSLSGEDRVQKLEKEIEKFNTKSKWEPYLINQTLEYRDCITEVMIYFGKDIDGKDYFFDMYGENKRIEIAIPDSILNLLSVGDTFLMTFGRLNFYYELLFCSLQYREIYVDTST